MHTRHRLSLILALAAVLAACGGPAPVPRPTAAPAATAASATPPATAPVYRVLRVNVGAYPETMDPQQALWYNEFAHARLIYEGLTRLNRDLEAVPAAAERWEYNADATQITFTLRSGLTYSDGSLLNAKRFEYALLRAIDPRTEAYGADLLFDIRGAMEWAAVDLDRATENEHARLRAGVRVLALDMHGQPCTGYEQPECLQLHIHLRKTAPYFHEIMSMPIGFPVKEENVIAGGVDWWSHPALQAGNGPFTISTLEPSVRTRFVPNLHYWRGMATYAVEHRYITDTARLLQAYAQDEIDMAGYGAAGLPQIESDPVLQKQALVYPGSCTFAVMFNQRKALFTDRQVRAAFALALDRNAWIHEVMSDTVLPTLTWIAPGFPGYQAGETRWAYDPERARQALAESSYGGPDALQAIDFLFDDTPRNRPRMEWLARQWQTVLGVNFVMEPAGNPYGPFTSDVDRTPFVFFTGWCPDYPDPQDRLSNYWHIGGNGEQLDYDNAVLDAVLTQADKSADPLTRLDLYRQAQDLLIDDVPMAIMHNNAVRCLIKPRVQGIVVTPMDDTYGWCGAADPLTIRLGP